MSNKNLYLWAYSAQLNNRVVHGLVEAPTYSDAQQRVFDDNELVERVIHMRVEHSKTARNKPYIKWRNNLEKKEMSA